MFFFLWFAFISAFSLMPGKSLKQVQSFTSATGFPKHALAYALLAILAFPAFIDRVAWPVLIGVFFISIGFEGAQRCLLDRTFNPMDILANALGLAAGVLLSLAWRTYGRRLAKTCLTHLRTKITHDP